MKIICDSMSDVPKEIIKNFDIEVVPLVVIVDGKEYLDGVDIENEKFYEILKNNETLPKTSQISYMRFKEIFEKYKDEEILYIGGSSRASGTYQSAVMASKDVDAKIHTFDTYSLSVCSACFVVKAAFLKEEGKSAQEIIEELEALKGSETAFFFVDNLEHLQKGGRISSAKAAIGTLLNIKPILTIEDGIVLQKSQVRGKKQVLSTLINETLNSCQTLDDRIIILACCDNEKDCETIKEKILEISNPKEVFIVNIGAVVSSHSGPSIVGMATL